MAYTRRNGNNKGAFVSLSDSTTRRVDEIADQYGYKRAEMISKMLNYMVKNYDRMALRFDPLHAKFTDKPQRPFDKTRINSLIQEKIL